MFFAMFLNKKKLNRSRENIPNLHSRNGSDNGVMQYILGRSKKYKQIYVCKFQILNYTFRIKTRLDSTYDQKLLYFSMTYSGNSYYSGKQIYLIMGKRNKLKLINANKPYLQNRFSYFNF